MKCLFPSIGMAVFLGTTSALAQQASPMHESHLDLIDQDQNGSVSRAEYLRFMSAAFDKLDTDGDGYLRQADVSSLLPSGQFASMDSNGDTRVDRNEFTARVTRNFQSADKNGDGHLR